MELQQISDGYTIFAPPIGDPDEEIEIRVNETDAAKAKERVEQFISRIQLAQVEITIYE